MPKKQKLTTSQATWYGLAVVRILLGLMCLWAFFDKLLGWGVSTPAAKAWVNGGSPTTGFLKAAQGPFDGFFHGLAGQGWIDVIFMVALLGIGLGLLLGIAVRLSAVSGMALFFMMWMASLPIKTNPLIDEHLVYVAVLIAIYGGLAEQKWSLASWWQQLPTVKSNGWLK